MAIAEHKVCQNCKRPFIIDASDFVFYKKMQVPPPTFCPECRFVRRLTWRNERALYRRKDAFGKDLISIYVPETRVVVYDRDYWWSDQWDPLTTGKTYDFTKPFFVQFAELLQTTPVPNVFSNTVIDSPYTNHVGYMKSCYLVFASWECEHALYGEKLLRTRDTLDAFRAVDCELCYEIVDCEKSHRLFFSRDCTACVDSYFLYDCKNCSNCFGCVGLRNKEYYFFNQPYHRETYLEKIKEYIGGSYGALQAVYDQFLKLCLTCPHRFAHLTNTTNTVGDHGRNMKNCYCAFDLEDTQDSKYVTHGGMGLKDSYDCYGAGASAELLYETVDTGANGSLNRFSIVVYACNDTHYCFNCEGSSYLFGCVGVRNKKYCILNKQYMKGAYEALLPQIIAHMNTMPYVDARGNVYKYGEFFPPDFSPFAYNETIAQEHAPLTKDDAVARGYRFRDEDARQYVITMHGSDLSDEIDKVDDSILKDVVGCMHEGKCSHQCTTAFKIIPAELQFYRTMHLPLPRLCPNCRHHARLTQRNPLKLWHRACACGGHASLNGVYKNTAAHFHADKPCLNEFETSYSPERKEIVYCESCYNKEVV